MAEETASCAICGAVMADVAKHEEWHAHVASVEAKADDAQATADDALDRAEQAQNVLYQNNIQV